MGDATTAVSAEPTIVTAAAAVPAPAPAPAPPSGSDSVTNGQLKSEAPNGTIGAGVRIVGPGGAVPASAAPAGTGAGPASANDGYSSGTESEGNGEANAEDLEPQLVAQGFMFPRRSKAYALGQGPHDFECRLARSDRRASCDVYRDLLRRHHKEASEFAAAHGTSHPGIRRFRRPTAPFLCRDHFGDWHGQFNGQDYRFCQRCKRPKFLTSFGVSSTTGSGARRCQACMVKVETHKAARAAKRAAHLAEAEELTKLAPPARMARLYEPSPTNSAPAAADTGSAVGAVAAAAAAATAAMMPQMPMAPMAMRPPVILHACGVVAQAFCLFAERLGTMPFLYGETEDQLIWGPLRVLTCRPERLSFLMPMPPSSAIVLQIRTPIGEPLTKPRKFMLSPSAATPGACDCIAWMG